ncbi:hypothetical protein MKW94_008155 [Papaver nudicaule]|uniref:Alpha/beta hydrolase fold-3 domain-containing protein n=1 Tax=Papaver nudicaule TaxID=74823 RepID=A0AA41SC36_PAPNU|nr:hypothetical protein [Papaver nudicaule]
MTSAMNPYELLRIMHNPAIDTLIRNSPNPITNPNDDPDTKDVNSNPINKIKIRNFKPPQSQQNHEQLFPMILYSTIFYNFSKSMGNQLSTKVLSVKYRLASEHRLPASYEDVVESLIWVQKQVLDTMNGEPWMRNYGDFSRCFVMWCSAGGNIAYQCFSGASELDLTPITICGLILNQPHYGGVERTSSELRLVNDERVSLVVNDLLWELALPIGVNRDLVYCNPFIDENLERKLRFISRCLVAFSKRDPLVVRDIEFAKMLEGKCVEIMNWIEESGFYGMAHTDQNKVEQLFKVIKDFIFSEV